MKVNTLYVEIENPEFLKVKNLDGTQTGNIVTVQSDNGTYVLKSDVYLKGFNVPVTISIGYITGAITVTPKKVVGRLDMLK